MFALIAQYAMVYIMVRTIATLTVELGGAKGGLWCEFFPSPERSEKDRLRREELRSNMNFIDKFFLLLFNLLKKW